MRGIRLVPTWAQFKASLTSRLTVIGTMVGILSLTLAIAFWMFPRQQAQPGVIPFPVAYDGSTAEKMMEILQDEAAKRHPELKPEFELQIIGKDSARFWRG